MKLTELNKSMNDDQRFALHFGPYHAPPFHYGDAVMDEVRGEVTVIKLSDAKIPWPIGKLRQGRSLIVYGGPPAGIRHYRAIALPVNSRQSLELFLKVSSVEVSDV